jgi:hypothetical protein
MESLAVVIIILFLIALFAGPMAIVLTADQITKNLRSKDGNIFKFINLVRRLFLLVLVFLASIVGFQFLTLGELLMIPRVSGLFALVTSYIAIRREFFPNFLILRSFVKRLKNSKNRQKNINSSE